MAKGSGEMNCVFALSRPTYGKIGWARGQVSATALLSVRVGNLASDPLHESHMDRLAPIVLDKSELTLKSVGVVLKISLVIGTKPESRKLTELPFNNELDQGFETPARGSAYENEAFGVVEGAQRTAVRFARS